MFGGAQIHFTLNLKGQKLRRNIVIHGELVIPSFHFPKKTNSLHFYECGPNGNYQEFLKALHVLSRMPVGLVLVPKKHLPHEFCLESLGFQKT